MVRVLFLDIATQTGAAVDGPLESGKPIIMTFNCGSDGDRPGRAFYEYAIWLNGMITRFKPEIVGFEAALQQKKGEGAINSQVTAEKLLGLIAITKMLAYQHDLPARPCNVQQNRRHFVGNGHASKGDVINKCRLIGWAVANEDEADACCGWDALHGKLRVEQLERGHDGPSRRQRA